MQKEHFSAVIDQLKREFNSHEFIKCYMSMYEKEYVRALCKYVDSDAPFRTLNAQIARYLVLHAEELGIRPTNYRVPSENIKGNETYNQKWEKL